MNQADYQNSSFSACTTSPVIERKQKEPSLMQCLTTWVVRSVDEVSSQIKEDLADCKRPRAGERRLQEQVQQPHQLQQPAAQPRSDLRQRRSAAPTPVPQLQGQAMNQLPPYDFNPSASQPNFHTYPQQQYGPPGYFEGTYPQPGPGYGHGHGMMMGYPSWQGAERPFSPVQGYNAGGGSWYAGGFGWPMR